jgi:predicted DCC family thiol-disulfide oxidoreductase YuxK
LVLITDLGILVKSDAVIEILLLLGGRWRFVVLLKIIPRKFRDRIYDWIAANRYLWSGNISKCLSMNEKFSDRILI